MQNSVLFIIPAVWLLSILLKFSNQNIHLPNYTCHLFFSFSFHHPTLCSMFKQDHWNHSMAGYQEKYLVLAHSGLLNCCHSRNAMAYSVLWSGMLLHIWLFCERSRTIFPSKKETTYNLISNNFIIIYLLKRKIWLSIVSKTVSL